MMDFGYAPFMRVGKRWVRLWRSQPPLNPAGAEKCFGERVRLLRALGKDVRLIRAPAPKVKLRGVPQGPTQRTSEPDKLYKDGACFPGAVPIRDLPPDARAELPDDVVHVEWEPFEAFGVVRYRLVCWRLGVKGRSSWRDGAWRRVDGPRPYTPGTPEPPPPAKYQPPKALLRVLAALSGPQQEALMLLASGDAVQVGGHIVAGDRVCSMEQGSQGWHTVVDGVCSCISYRTRGSCVHTGLLEEASK